MSIAKENPVGPSFARSQTGSSGQHRLTWDRYHRLSGINYTTSNNQPQKTKQTNVNELPPPSSGWNANCLKIDINSYLEHLKEAHADWIEVMPIGKSSQGRPIHVIKLSRRRQPDRVETSQKKAILVDAGASVSTN